MHVGLDEDIFGSIIGHLRHFDNSDILILEDYDRQGRLFNLREIFFGSGVPIAFAQSLSGLKGSTMRIRQEDADRISAGMFVEYDIVPEIFEGGTADIGTISMAASEMGIKSAHVMPLAYANNLYGAIVAMNTRETGFADKSLLEAYIVQASVAIARHVNEAGLLAQERLYHNYVTSAPDPIFVTNAAGQYVDANPAAIALTGYEKEELIGMRIIDLMHPERHAEAVEAFERVLVSGKTDAELLLRRKDGKLRWIRIDAVKLEDERNIAFCKDITTKREETERKERLHQLLQSVRTLDQLIVRAPDRDSFHRRALSSLVDNGAYGSGWIAWLAEDGSVKKTYHYLTPRPREFDEMLANGNPVPCYVKALESDEPIISNHCELDICKACPLMSTYPQNMSFTKRLVSDGTVQGIISLQLPDKYGSLDDEQRLFNEICDEIAFAMGGIAEKERQAHREQSLRMQRKELSDFAHIFSHDVRNDLYAIKAYAGLEDIDEKSRFERISQKVDELSAFLEKCVALAEAGKVVGEPEPANIGDIATACRELFENRCHIAIEGRMPVVWADPVKMRQVFVNIIDNAVVHGNASQVTIRASLVDAGMRILFEDNGSGIDEKLLPSMFEWGNSSKPDNRGIGLSVIKHIISAHGGVVAAWNTETGAAVSMRFPRSIVDIAAWNSLT
jgi:PAS domain S-box-containing protein